jgi:hypothetical protein
MFVQRQAVLSPRGDPAAAERLVPLHLGDGRNQVFDDMDKLTPKIEVTQGFTKVVMVTGATAASAGAVAFARARGHRPGAIDQGEIAKEAGKISRHAFDFGDASWLRRSRRRIVQAGRSAAVNNAIIRHAPANFTEKDWDDVRQPHLPFFPHQAWRWWIGPGRENPPDRPLPFSIASMLSFRAASHPLHRRRLQLAGVTAWQQWSGRINVNAVAGLGAENTRPCAGTVSPRRAHPQGWGQPQDIAGGCSSPLAMVI